MALLCAAAPLRYAFELHFRRQAKHAITPIDAIFAAAMDATPLPADFFHADYAASSLSAACRFAASIS